MCQEQQWQGTRNQSETKFPDDANTRSEVCMRMCGRSEVGAGCTCVCGEDMVVDDLY